MTMNVGRQIAELRRMTVTQLRRKHLEAFGEPTRSGHKDCRPTAGGQPRCIGVSYPAWDIEQAVRYQQ